MRNLLLVLFPLHIGARDIGALGVKCLASEKCGWEGCFNGFTTHKATCEYVTVLCPKQCQDENNKIKSYYRKDLDQHLAVCPNRDASCEHCGTTGTHASILVHDEVCMKKVVHCSNAGCSVTVVRENLTEHISKECQHTLLPCEYKHIIGCGMKRKRKDLAEHERGANAHLHMAMDTIFGLQQKVAKLEAVQDKLGERLDELKTRTIQPVSTFKIMHFSEKKDSNRVYTSQPFYTSESGYNIAIEVYTNGTTDVEDTHLSAFVVVKNGRNDSSLPWPFTGHVTITLLNQTEDRNHHSMTISMKKGLKWGYPKFIPQERLAYNPGTKTCYLQNDALHFRVTVESVENKPWLNPMPEHKNSTHPTVSYYYYR